MYCEYFDLNASKLFSIALWLFKMMLCTQRLKKDFMPLAKQIQIELYLSHLQ